MKGILETYAKVKPYGGRGAHIQKGLAGDIYFQMWQQEKPSTDYMMIAVKCYWQGYCYNGPNEGVQEDIGVK